MVLKIYPSQKQFWFKKSLRHKTRLLLCLSPVIILLLWFGYKQWRSLEKPQAVLMLGGSTSALEREKFTADFARHYPDLPIWISSGSSVEYAAHYNDYIIKVFAKAGIESHRLHLDEQAVDTVTNFTTLVDDLKSRGIHRVYLITADYHMRRAQIIGEFILGSRGIDFQPVSVPTNRSPESITKAFRDATRAILWLTIGYTGVPHNQPSNTINK